MNYQEIHKKYTPLVHRLIRRFPEQFQEDLEQEAYIALYEAFKVWNPKRASFMTLAYRYIKTACSKYVRDKAYIIRVPARKHESGLQIECESLDQLVREDLSLSEIFGSESKEDLLDLSITVWDQLKLLADKKIIRWKDFGFLYFRFFQQCQYRVIGEYFGCSEKYVHQQIQRVLQRIRPYFLGKKRI